MPSWQGFPLGLTLPEVASVGHLPAGRVIELPGRGSTYVVDSGHTDAAGPTFVLLHSVACTGLLTWYASLELVRRFGRVVVFDQRGHGQGITSPRFLLEDCADDVAALANELGVDSFIPVGFSMGSLVAQLVWRRHRDRTDGLVLCAGAARFGGTAAYRRFGTGIFAGLLDAVSPEPARLAAAASPHHGYFNDRRWAYGQFRATSAGTVMRAVAELLRFDSRRWVAEIDVPTAVVLTLRDRAVPSQDQRWLAGQIPRAHTVTVDAGHACCTLNPEAFLPGLQSALEWMVDHVDRADGARAVSR
ncbi:MAG: alpha/beta fold hydrolase [Mycobacterium sp.]